MEGLRAAGSRPADAKAGAAPLVAKGLIRDWLVLGPFGVKDSVTELDRDFLDGERTVEPAAGEKLGGLGWSPLEVAADDIMVFGAAEPPWLDLAQVVGFQRNQIAYAHTWLNSPRGGPARVIADHCFGLKAWVNGEEVYRNPQRDFVLGSYPAISTQELRHKDERSPRFDVTLRAGWNRLLLKLSTSNREDFTEMRCSLRIMDGPDVTYETRNIVWMTPLPARSTSTPIMVGDRLFVMCEPDELLCIDKHSGDILWSAQINDYEALEPDAKKANPAYVSRIDPLVEELKREKDQRKRTRLRGQIRTALEEIDAGKFRLATDGHFEAHFGIVGFTMPTPVSDGTHVFIWSGMGVAASFALDGTRQWITRIPTGDLSYGSSPALADGVLAVFLHGLFGLDAKTGGQRWKQQRLNNNIGAIQGTTLAGQQVFVSQRGDILRPGDGAFLFRPKGSSAAGDTGWAPPQLLGDRMISSKYGVTNLQILDFSAVTGDSWTPRQIASISLPREVNVSAGGKWLDRWTPASPMAWEGISYLVDIYQTLYAVDLESGKLLYRQEMELNGLTHYNAVAVAASPTLVGKHILLMDNQGTTLVVEPGSTYEVVARNVIATQLDRAWPIPAQETLCYAPPLADGNRLYLRGEAFLYCVGRN